MSAFEDFVHISTTGARGHGATASAGSVPGDFFENSRGQRQCTQALMVDSLRKYHPEYHVTVTDGFLNFAGFAVSRDDIVVSPHGDPAQSIIERQFIPPPRRYGDEGGGLFLERIVFGCFDYHFEGTDFILYSVTGADGLFSNTFNYVLTPIDDGAAEDSALSAQEKADEFISAASSWSQELHDEILVFDGGYWDKNKELWKNVQNANWEDVILAKERKKAIIDDVVGFFDSQKRYAEFEVPWKRGVIFYGPPGNGKTISTKALMHDVAKRVSPKVESLYVKTFNSYAGPEYGIRQIFLMARQMAPCLLIFEDIDSLVNPMVRSYFLNEVDGLESNHGILMIGSTNHLERLDPGIAKRPSRFDRKYFFDVPNKEERTQYAEYWRNKLRNNKKIDFPKEMCARVADITGDFSFAYMKEAFVAALLVIVAHGEDKPLSGRGGGDDLSNNILWKELKKQVENLRREMDSESESQAADVDTRSRRVINDSEATRQDTELPRTMGQRAPASGRENPWDGNSLTEMVSQLRQVEQRANDAFRPHPWRRQRGFGRPGDRNPSLFHEMGSRLDYLQACADLSMLDEQRDNVERPALPARNRQQGRREEARGSRHGNLDGLPDLVPW